MPRNGYSSIAEILVHVAWLFGGGGGGGVHFFINCKYDFSFNAERMIVKTQELVPQKGC